MECKLCSKKFSNGKALGGHMRHHYATLPLPTKTLPKQEHGEPLTESTSSLLTSDEKEISSGEKSLSSAFYGLREYPGKSFRVADPKFLDVGSIVVDRESESESTRGRCEGAKEMSVESLAKLEKEEDIALCLVMLSRDVWRSKMHKCEKCDKVFKSSQGLGSHKTTHDEKKILFKKIIKDEQVHHKCRLCGKIFSSGQALGGHKRSHFLAAKVGEDLVGINASDKFKKAPIDLNIMLIEDEDEGFGGEI